MMDLECQLTKLTHSPLRGGHPALVPDLQAGDEAEQDDHEGAEAEEEGDGDGQLALEVHHHRKRGKDSTSSVPVRRLQAIFSLPLQTLVIPFQGGFCLVVILRFVKAYLVDFHVLMSIFIRFKAPLHDSYF